MAAEATSSVVVAAAGDGVIDIECMTAVDGADGAGGNSLRIATTESQILHAQNESLRQFGKERLYRRGLKPKPMPSYGRCVVEYALL